MLLKYYYRINLLLKNDYFLPIKTKEKNASPPCRKSRDDLEKSVVKTFTNCVSKIYDCGLVKQFDLVIDSEVLREKF